MFRYYNIYSWVHTRVPSHQVSNNCNIINWGYRVQVCSFTANWKRNTILWLKDNTIHIYECCSTIGGKVVKIYIIVTPGTINVSNICPIDILQIKLTTLSTLHTYIYMYVYMKYLLCKVITYITYICMYICMYLKQKNPS